MEQDFIIGYKGSEYYKYLVRKGFAIRKTSEREISGFGGTGRERYGNSIGCGLAHELEVCYLLPACRQKKGWKQYGAQIHIIYYNWPIYCVVDYFQPVYKYFHRKTFKPSFVIADKSRVWVLKEDER